MSQARPFRLIGDVINNSYARARKAWEARDVTGYQKLARRQVDLGAEFLDVNLDGNQMLQVRPEEMRAFLPALIPALQEATPVSLVFDNPSIDFHREALKHYDRSRGPAPVVNSIAASRERLDEMIELVRLYDTWVVVMASEKMTPGGSAQCFTAQEVYESAKYFTGILRTKAGRTDDQIIIDPGLAPVGADTYGLVNMGLDAMRLIRQDPDLRGVHLSVGLTNFSFGVPKDLRKKLENAYITLAVEAGLDFILGNPEHELQILESSDPVLQGVIEALKQGRPQNGESQEEAGFRQSEVIMKLYQ